MTTIAARVAAGSAFLDEHDPGWWRADADRAINLNAFSIISGDRCVLGQRCPLSLADGPGFTPYAEFLSGLEDTDEVWAWAAPLGFAWHVDEFSEPEHDAELDDLTAEWVRVITQRRVTP